MCVCVCARVDVYVCACLLGLVYVCVCGLVYICVRVLGLVYSCVRVLGCLSPYMLSDVLYTRVTFCLVLREYKMSC